jgi:hypothetical protein
MIRSHDPDPDHGQGAPPTLPSATPRERPAGQGGRGGRGKNVVKNFLSGIFCRRDSCDGLRELGSMLRNLCWSPFR